MICLKILVLDGNSILNRAFYGIKLLTTKDGRFTNAIYGFLNILLRLPAGRLMTFSERFQPPAPTTDSAISPRETGTLFSL